MQMHAQSRNCGPTIAGFVSPTTSMRWPIRWRSMPLRLESRPLLDWGQLILVPRALPVEAGGLGRAAHSAPRRGAADVVIIFNLVDSVEGATAWIEPMQPPPE
jgi:hypothetical protein